MTEHTTGPIRAGAMRMSLTNWKRLHSAEPFHIIQRGMNVLAVVWDIDDIDKLEDVMAKGNARRLAACWNACDGMTTEELEKRGITPYVDMAKIIRALEEALLFIGEQKPRTEAIRPSLTHPNGGHRLLDSPSETYRVMSNLESAIKAAKGEA